MTTEQKIVHCAYLHKDAVGLERQTYPGDIGRRIYENISQEAWIIWLKKQTMIINEKKLTFFREEHRKLIEQMMVDFLFEGKDVEVDGYKPQEDK